VSCLESKDTSRVGREGNFFMLITATLPSTLILYQWAVLAWQW